MTEQNNESQIEKNIVWIFGANRSGTTWLVRQIGELSNNYVGDEPLIGEHLGISIQKEGKIKRYYDLYSNQRDYFFSDNYKTLWSHYLRKLILNRFYSEFNNLNKKIIVKEPNGSQSADILLECLPLSKAIFLIRDPRDIIDSRLDALSEKGWSAKRGWSPITQKNRMSFIKRESMKWVSLMEIMKQATKQNNKNKLIIFYENLRKNTFTELKKIYQFIEIDITDKKIQDIIDLLSFENIPDDKKGPGKRKRSATPGKWKDSFTVEEKAIMIKIMGEKISEIGYTIE